jgi:hypothetical protein
MFFMFYLFSTFTIAIKNIQKHTQLSIFYYVFLCFLMFSIVGSKSYCNGLLLQSNFISVDCKKKKHKKT